LKNDAHNGDWKKYPITEHSRFGHKITTGSMIAKLNSKKEIRVEGIFHPPKIHWLTNLNDSIHLHMDTIWACCLNTLTKRKSLNMGTLSETGPSTPEAYKQQWPDEDDHWEMPNPIQIGPPNPYEDNHDPYADFDEG